MSSKECYSDVHQLKNQMAASTPMHKQKDSIDNMKDELDKVLGTNL